MKKLALTTIGILFYLSNIYSQEVERIYKLHIVVNDIFTGEVLEAANIKIIGSDSSIFETETNSTGNLENPYSLKANTEYSIIVEKESYFKAKGIETTVGEENSKFYYHEYLLQPEEEPVDSITIQNNSKSSRNILIFEPKTAKEYYDRGKEKVRYGDKEGAKEDLEYSKYLEKNAAIDYFHKGLEVAEYKLYNEAIYYYTKAIELDSTLGYAYNNRGNINIKRKNYQEALDDYNKAIEITPTEPLYHFNKGFVLMNYLKKDLEAILCFDKVIEIDSNYNEGSAYFNRGLIKVGLKDLEGALNDYNSAIGINPDNQHNYWERASVYRKLSKKEEAKKDMKKFSDIRKSYVLNKKVNKKIDSGNYQGAIELCNEMLLINPRDKIAYCNRGISKDELGKHHEAIIDFNKAIQLDSKFAFAYFNRGFSKNALEDYDGSCEDWEKALELGSEVAKETFEKYCE